MDENKQVKIVESDLYDSIVDEVAQFTGILVGVATRYATTCIIVPENDTLMKRVLRDTGNIVLSTAAMGLTQQGVKVIGAYLKPVIVRK